MYKSREEARATRKWRRRWESSEIGVANSSTIWKVPFPRRFPIIRYLVRVPLSRSYVTHRRVSVGVVLKRFMNYVDRSACGRSLNTLVARSSQPALLDCWQNVVYRPWIWWMNPRQPKRGVTLYPLYQTGIVVVSSSFNGLFVLFAIGSSICTPALGGRPLGGRSMPIQSNWMDERRRNLCLLARVPRILVPNVSSSMCCSQHRIEEFVNEFSAVRDVWLWDWRSTLTNFVLCIFGRKMTELGGSSIRWK